MVTEIKTRTNKNIFAGSKDILGANLTEGGANFALFSENASEVYLLLFDNPDGDPTDIIEIENKTDNIWHVFIEGIKAGQFYAYKVFGEYNPYQGKRFNPYKLLFDPYGKAFTGKIINKENLIFGYDINAEGRDLVMDERDNTHIMPKSIVVDDNFDWQGDTSPNIPMDQLIIYEAHIKGFTAHESSGVNNPGTYPAFAEKIPYLKELGINAVELMPIHEFYLRDDLLNRGLTDFWGYNTIGFFAPEISYCTKSSPGCQVNEFKNLVKELHKAGIEVILDVVYNHTGEGNEFGPTLSFKGIDNQTYYSLTQNPHNPEEMYRYYVNDTGTGNTFKVENPAAMHLVLDSMHYWTEVMHVDGFRFDLASILAKVKGEFSQKSKFFVEVSLDPVLNKVKMIAEPWDLRTYQVGNFPKGWSEWNGKFRDTARRFIKGDERQAGDMAVRITGSSDLYQDDGRKPYNSINFITCHDGFTLNDLFSYNSKHNEANLEDNRDGDDDNNSWNCGEEGETENTDIIYLRKKLIKNALSCLLLSSGTPMITYGDEVGRTQKGNNNAYCQDNELTWFDWGLVEKNAEILEFCKKCISFRKAYPMLRRRRFFTGKDTDHDNIPDISWYGKYLKTPDWRNPKLRAFSYLLAGSETLSTPGNYYIFVIFNMYYRGAFINLPTSGALRWYRLIDTSRKSGDDFRTDRKEKLLRKQSKYYCSARSVSVLLGEP